MTGHSFGGGEALGPWGDQPDNWFGSPGGGDPEASATQPWTPGDAPAGLHGVEGGLDPEYLNADPGGAGHLTHQIEVDGIPSKES